MTLGITGFARGKGGRRLGLKAAGAVVAVAGLTALTACGGGSSGGSGSTVVSVNGAYGSLPAQSGTAHAGTIKLGVPLGLTPWILPIVTAAANSIYTVYDFDYLMYRPLYWYGSGTNIAENSAESVANDPVYSNGDTTVSITVKSNYKWSDGQPLTSQDILFWYDEAKAGIAESAANWATYVPGLGLPDEVSSVSTPSSSTIVFNLKKAVNPTWFTQDQLGTVQPMPSHAWAIDAAGGKTLDFTNPANAKKIYDYLSSASKSVSTYASNPLWQIVDGPYKLTSLNATNSDYTMAPNTSYSGPHAAVMSNLSVESFTSDAPEYNALKAGALDVGYVPIDDVTQAHTLSSTYSIFGYPGYGWQGAFYNFKDTTGHFNSIIGQLYIRQALQHLVDQQGIIKAYLHNAGGIGYGTVGKYPPYQYTPSDDQTNLYPYSASDASTLLKDHGWSVTPGGTDTCVKPGTASDECGAGIPAGTPLSWNMLTLAGNQLGQEEDTNFASAAKSVGIEITLKSDSFANLIGNYNDVSTPKNDNAWAMNDFGGETNSTYPTTFGLFNSTGSANLGGYADTTADSLINASINSSDAGAVESELTYLAKDLPVLFQPNPDWAGEGGVLAVNKAISGPPSAFESYAAGYWLNPEFWYAKS